MRRLLIALVGLALSVGAVQAQTGGFSGGSGGTGGGSTSSGFTGGGGVFGGSGTGSSGTGNSSGFTGGGGIFGGAGGATGGATGGARGGLGGGATGGIAAGATGSGQYGATSFLGQHFANPIAMGVRSISSNSATASTGSIGQPVITNYRSLVFGQPVYNNTGGTASVGTGIGGGGLGTTTGAGALGTTGGINRGGTIGTFGTGAAFGGNRAQGGALGGGLGGNLGGLGQGGLLGQQGGVVGASTVGIRRAPQYYTEPAFDMPTRASVGTIREDLQRSLAESTMLRSGSQIRVIAEGESVVLRGQVANDREKRVAEAMVRMTPGIRAVVNELVVDKKP
jgi:hypothetical protein